MLRYRWPFFPFQGFSVRSKEAEKGARRMPWLSEAMKDAVSCDNPGLGANGP